MLLHSGFHLSRDNGSPVWPPSTVRDRVAARGLKILGAPRRLATGFVFEGSHGSQAARAPSWPRPGGAVRLRPAMQLGTCGSCRRAGSDRFPPWGTIGAGCRAARNLRAPQRGTLKDGGGTAAGGGHSVSRAPRRGQIFVFPRGEQNNSGSGFSPAQSRGQPEMTTRQKNCLRQGDRPELFIAPRARHPSSRNHHRQIPRSLATPAHSFHDALHSLLSRTQ